MSHKYTFPHPLGKMKVLYNLNFYPFYDEINTIDPAIEENFSYLNSIKFWE